MLVMVGCYGPVVSFPFSMSFCTTSSKATRGLPHSAFHSLAMVSALCWSSSTLAITAELNGKAALICCSTPPGCTLRDTKAHPKHRFGGVLLLLKAVLNSTLIPDDVVVMVGRGPEEELLLVGDEGVFPIVVKILFCKD